MGPIGILLHELEAPGLVGLALAIFIVSYMAYSVIASVGEFAYGFRDRGTRRLEAEREAAAWAAYLARTGAARRRGDRGGSAGDWHSGDAGDAGSGGGE